MLDLDDPRPFAARTSATGKVHWVQPQRGARCIGQAWCGMSPSEAQRWLREVGDGAATAPVDLVTCGNCVRYISEGAPIWPNILPARSSGASAAPTAPSTAPSTEVDIVRPPLESLLPREIRDGSRTGRESSDRLRASLRTVEREVTSMRTRYLAFRTWVIDETQRALAEDELRGCDEPGRRSRALLDVIERLPEG